MAENKAKWRTRVRKYRCALELEEFSAETARGSLEIEPLGSSQTGMSKYDLKQLRKQLVSAMSGRESHITFDKVIENFPPEARGRKPQGAPHSAWELIEHMRIAQRDMLDFSRDPNHKSPEFPDGYWPGNEAPPSEAAWNQSVAGFQRDAGELTRLVESEDLFTAFPHGEGQTLLREALLVATHNSYHLGELVFLKRMLTGKA